MSHIREHSKTGIFWYRRVVPADLRPFLPPVAGFSDKPNRTEFSKSLQTRTKGEANRKAGAIDTLVDAALEEARRRKQGALHQTTRSSPLPAAVQSFRRSDLLSAIDRWRRHQTKQAEIRLFNGDVTSAPWEQAVEVPDGRYNLQQYAHYTRSNANLWARIPTFDVVMLGALTDEGMLLLPSHPVLPNLRPEFAAAWDSLLKAVDAMRQGRWSSDEEDEPSPRQVVTLHPAQTFSKTRTPFLHSVEGWSKLLPFKERQVSMYVSVVRSFADANPDLCIEQLRKADVQGWVDTQLGQGFASKTLQRKLSALRDYWRYLQSKQVADVGLEPFNKLYLKEGRKKTSTDEPRRGDCHFEPKDVVRLWRAARERGDNNLADAIRIAALTGARIESICQLTVGDIDIDETSGIEFVAFNDKTEAGNRKVPIHLALRPMLRRLGKATRDSFLIPSNAKNQYNERSAPLSKRFGRLRTELGFKQGYVLHSIRKTVATLFERSDCPENIAADILGHKKPTMTYGTYSGGSAIERQRHWIEVALKYPDQEFMTAS